MALAALIWRGAVLAAGQLDGEEDVVGVGAHDALDRVRLEVLLLVGLQVEHDLGAAAHAVGLLLGGGDHLEAGAARRAPHPRLARPRPAARHLDPVRDHEGGIEADAELADEPGAVLGLGEAAHEGARAGAGDGAEVVDQLLAVHADAGIGNRQRAGAGVRRQADEERSGVSEQRWRSRSPRSAACRRHPRRWRSARAGRCRSRSRRRAPSGAAARPPRPGTRASGGCSGYRCSWRVLVSKG